MDRALFILLLLVQYFSVITTIDSSDQDALLSFKSQLEDPLAALSSWNLSQPLCNWYGVTCRTSRIVSALDLESLDLSGPISPSLANLSSLKRLHMPYNQLRGPIPETLGNIYSLQHINLSSNSLSGNIPESVLNISALRNISFRNNLLQGELPAKFPLLLNLLDLSNNMFAGTIPISLANITSLTYLDVSNNTLIGVIPPVVGMLTSLTFFDMSRNNLTGDVTFVSNMTKLKKFEVHTNNLSGIIPSDIGTKLPYLQRLLVYENQFSGNIPASIANATDLQWFEMYYNELTGKIPRNLGRLQNLYSLILGNNWLGAENDEDWMFFTGLVNCSKLQILDISNNDIGGVLPWAVANLSRQMTWLGIMGNHIGGTVPMEIDNLVNLSELRMKENLLTGRIPASIGRMKTLQEIYLSSNNFEGEIPSEFGNLTELNYLYLNHNNLTGTIPSNLGNCKNLLLLNLGFNKLSGIIPLEILTISSLSIYLSFANNSLSGPLPSQIGSLINLDALDVSNNAFYGEIPKNLGDCVMLEFQYLEGNQFQGSIPSSFGQLRGLLELDLSRNNLSGQIPDFLASLHNLDILNLSYNNFEGEVPDALSNSSEVILVGNYNLCGGNASFNLPKCAVRRTHHSSTKIIISIIIPLFIVVLSLCIVLFYCVKKSQKVLQENVHTVVSYNDLFRATDGFSDENLIGMGSFGAVYRATLTFGDVAIKVIDNRVKNASRTFIKECESLRILRHRNLIKILTICSSMDSEGNDFRALIFEFMPNGSLEKWLHHREENDMLSCTQRLDIAIDVACAIDYLHSGVDTPIVHCDLKPSNVLLGDGFVARVGDFGLARFLERTDTSQVSISSNGLQGTIGYVPPEYAMTNRVSIKGDVYSYGIMLLEMFSGKKPTDSVFTGDTSLRKLIESAFRGNVMDVADAHIVTYDTQHQELFMSVFRIGLACTRESPGERMQMKEVVNELTAAKGMFICNEMQENKVSEISETAKDV